MNLTNFVCEGQSDLYKEDINKVGNIWGKD